MSKGLRPVVRLACEVLAGALLLALGWGAWYVSTKGLSRRSRQFITSEFHKHGVEVSIRRLTLDPFKGLVARDVEIVDEQGHALAEINRLILDINYSNLLRHEPFLDAVDLRNAKLNLPIDRSTKGSPRIRITGLNAHLELPPHQAYLPHAEADVYGIHITATGRLINPELYRPPPPSAKKAKEDRSASIARWVKELKSVRYLSEAPRIDVRFIGDLAHPEAMFADAALWGRKIERRDYRLENLYASATLRDGFVDLKRFTAADRSGTLDGSGSYDLGAKWLQFRLHSTLDLQALAHSAQVGPSPGDFVLRKPPVIDVSGGADFHEKPVFNALGHVATGPFTVKTVEFLAADADFSYADGNWFVRGLRAQHATGELTANVLQLPGDFRLRAESNLNPRVLLPLMPQKAVETLADWDFRDAPEARIEVRGASASDPDGWDTSGQVRLGQTVLRGVPMNRAVSGVRFKDGAFTCEDFTIVRNEGSATGTFTYDFRQHEAHLAGIKAALKPAEAIVWVNPGLVEYISPYRFKTRPNVSVDGFVGDKGTDLEVFVNAPAGMDYTFLKKNLSASRIAGRLLFTNDRLRISNLDAAVFGGRLQGNADISLAQNDKGYSAQMTAQGIDFAALTKLYFDYEGSQGMMDGHYDFAGIGDDTRTIQGQGAVTVSDGNVFAIPILGPLSGVLNGIVPGMGYNVAHKASSTFQVRDGVIHTRDFLVDGKGFHMLGGGSIDFADDRLDFDIRLDAKGIPGTLLFPVSELFEYTSTGTLEKPAWHPKRLPLIPPKERAEPAPAEKNNEAPTPPPAGSGGHAMPPNFSSTRRPLEAMG